MKVYEQKLEQIHQRIWANLKKPIINETTDLMNEYNALAAVHKLPQYDRTPFNKARYEASIEILPPPNIKDGQKHKAEELAFQPINIWNGINIYRKNKLVRKTPFSTENKAIFHQTPIFKKKGTLNYRHHYGINIICKKHLTLKNIKKNIDDITLEIKCPEIDFDNIPELKPYRNEIILLISQIRTASQIVFNHGKIKQSDDFFGIPSNNLRIILGRHKQKKVIDLLIKYNLIECDNLFYFVQTKHSSFQPNFLDKADRAKHFINPKTFENKGKTLGYRLHKSIRNESSKKYILTHDRSQIKRICELFYKNIKELKNPSPVEKSEFKKQHHFLYDCLANITVENIGNAKRFVKEYYENKIKETLKDLNLSDDEKQTKIAQNEQTIIMAEDALSDIFDGKYRMTMDTFSKRIHTNITNLLSPLKNYLKFKDSDEKLIELDIVNSQPLCLAIFFKQVNELYKSKTFNNKINILKYASLINKDNYINSINQLKDILKLNYKELGYKRDSNQKEFEKQMTKYNGFVERGSFYDWLAEAITIKANLGEFKGMGEKYSKRGGKLKFSRILKNGVDREIIKTCFYRYLFAPNKKSFNKKTEKSKLCNYISKMDFNESIVYCISKAMSDEFPLLEKLIKKIKRPKYWNKKKNCVYDDNRYKDLSKMLQIIEVHILLNTVYLIQRECKGNHVLTIHDSIVTIKSNKKLVQKSFKKVLRDLGVKGKIKESSLEIKVKENELF